MTGAQVQHIAQPSFHAYGAAVILSLGWLALFGPVYIEFAQTAWAREENGHIPFIMAICLGTAWARLTVGGLKSAPHIELLGGLGILSAGFAFYALGRAGEVDLLTSAAQPMIAVAIVLCLFGLAGVRRLWFPLFLSLYLIIWPGWAIEAATAPLKRMVSEKVSEALFSLGLPVAHSGAVISAGPYELLVADACAGLNSLIALTAVGAVYLYMLKRRSFKTNLAVILCIAPLAIVANLVRVAMLVLITLFWGYDAGQSFLHEAAGLVMFAIALLGVFAVDALATKLWEPRS